MMKLSSRCGQGAPLQLLLGGGAAAPCREASSSADVVCFRIPASVPGRGGCRFSWGACRRARSRLQMQR
jgi:hypothetical protein